MQTQKQNEEIILFFVCHCNDETKVFKASEINLCDYYYNHIVVVMPGITADLYSLKTFNNLRKNVKPSTQKNNFSNTQPSNY